MGEHRPRRSQTPAVDIRPAIADLTRALCADVSASHPCLAADCRKIVKRLEHEGVALSLSGLPRISRYLDTVLITGVFPTPPQGFVGKHGLPTLFPTFFKRLKVDIEMGVPHDISLVRSVRTLLRFFAKIDVPTDLVNAVDPVAKATEWKQRVSYDHCEPAMLDSHVIDYARRSITDLLSIDGDHGQSIVEKAFELCRHGPGVVADRRTGMRKWDMNPTQRVHESGLGELLRLNARHEDDVPSTVIVGDGCTKMILVPKDFRGPRIISCEPSSLQYLQQGLSRALMSHIETRTTEIGFTCQEINQELAMIGSREASYRRFGLETHDRSVPWATIDMKDASDLVSVSLVRQLFSGVPVILEWMDATRSTLSSTPIGIIPLQCFAPMGSALCFTVESIVFWALARASIDSLEKFPQSHGVHRHVRVYGDDILMHPGFVGDFSRIASRCGLVVNREKTCFITSFRESCGADFLQGECITTPRLNQLTPACSTLAAIASTHNSLPLRWSETRAQLRHIAHRFFPTYACRACMDEVSDANLFFVEDWEQCSLPQVKKRFACSPTTPTSFQRWEWLVPVLRKPQIEAAREGWGPVFAGVRRLATDWDTLPGELKLRMRWQSVT